MKTKETFVAVLMATASTWGFSAHAISGLTPFQEAYQKGADARIVFKVLDDGGNPVKGASVDVFFDMAARSKARRVVVRTDTNGICVAEAKTKGVLKIKVSCDGYYSSYDEICFIAMGHEHEVRRGRWQPWGMDKEMVLRPVKNPLAVKVPVERWRIASVTNQWIGFDLENYDFVKPHGKGVVADMEVKVDWDGLRFPNSAGMDVFMRFTEKYAGGYYQDRVMGSDFKDAYFALTNAAYIKEFQFFEHPIRDAHGIMVRFDKSIFDPAKVLVVRSRCVLDEQGRLKEARYSQIADFGFSCADTGWCIMLQTTYNPTPNDTNLEPKR